ncbi:hypothetical protein FVP74_06310 [Microbacterium saccharophilum]|uniref:PH domain-containing protein n=1 Tax=Microbacterium saccharophilum TaxID=1213358 RepID=A0A5C8I7L1_9MICO|nr:hypothetical protein [Microbacterium saccharophilum]TXK14190.1 hypothetical protein FVP74_06310 [Microbacterium saccharophilum]GEP46749.1 hypothetical protein MSA03_02570 [Microbacterium saccharophilum]
MSVQQPAEPIVFRSTFGIVLTVVMWAIAAAGIVASVLTGAGAVPVALLGALAWFVWLAYWRPCVVTDARGVVLRNLLSDVDIPFDAIEDVDTRYSLQVRADGRVWSAWGAPAPGGASAIRSGTRRPRAGDLESWRDTPRAVREAGSARAGDAVTTASGAPATVIRRELERRERHGIRRDETARVTVTRHPVLTAVSAVVLVLAAAAVLLGG